MMLQMWTNFSKFSDPTPKDSELGVSWEPLGSDQAKVLQIGSGLKMTYLDPTLMKRIEFWNKISDINQFPTSKKPILKIHTVTADKRNLVLDPGQLFA